MSIRRGALAAALAVMTLGVTAHAVGAQQTGQPASDVLLQFDPWGNPTPRGGVTNNGPNSHSVW
ncbi:MAG: hypothetical protein QF463_07360 [Vicinamibacterales bacterium]|jgi:hypothetical protein|nr:hypothetical protein [Acidobacteriota bacterium]MDP6372783.1 hypothetical protein [Vicinamibacterales bacterium]MDP6608867.1 hypothetical protein [Vicinamibacterales bacterium]HAK55088.1 hypothetical protein [Acidobacteriota bacterium]|tara:strand:- start:1831 stop:2022 length:192 start_codon:yes stop_codon:yes gene_type:complete